MAGILARHDIWLLSHVTFVKNDVPICTRTTFWGTMDVPKTLVDDFAQVDPWWSREENMLHVDEALRTIPDFWQKITAVVLAARRMINFSDTRFARGGKCGRLFVRSVGTGFDDAVKGVIDDNDFSSSYISGWPEFANKHVRRFFGTVAFSAQPCEFFIIEMLKDPLQVSLEPEPGPASRPGMRGRGARRPGPVGTGPVGTGRNGTGNGWRTTD